MSDKYLEGKIKQSRDSVASSLSPRLCPKCGSYKSKVTDVRYRKKDGLLHRTRRCLKCYEVWHTVEVKEL